MHFYLDIMTIVYPAMKNKYKYNIYPASPVEIIDIGTATCIVYRVNLTIDILKKT